MNTLIKNYSKKGYNITIYTGEKDSSGKWIRKTWHKVNYYNHFLKSLEKHYPKWRAYSIYEKMVDGSTNKIGYYERE